MLPDELPHGDSKFGTRNEPFGHVHHDEDVGRGHEVGPGGQLGLVDGDSVVQGESVDDLSLDSAQVRVHLEADDLRGGREEVGALKQNDFKEITIWYFRIQFV